MWSTHRVVRDQHGLARRAFQALYHQIVIGEDMLDLTPLIEQILAMPGARLSCSPIRPKTAARSLIVASFGVLKKPPQPSKKPMPLIAIIMSC